MGAQEFSCWDSVKTNMNKTQQHLFWVYKCQIIQAAFPEVSHLSLFFSPPILKELLHYFLISDGRNCQSLCGFYVYVAIVTHRLPIK